MQLAKTHPKNVLPGPSTWLDGFRTSGTQAASMDVLPQYGAGAFAWRVGVQNLQDPDG